MNWGSPVITNALLLVLLLATLYRAPMQRMIHKTKRGIKRTGAVIGKRIKLWREHRRRQ